MATQKAQTTSFLPENDPEAVEANRRYQEALNKLTQSLDTRKNRFFDPVWLAAAQGFASAKTPDFFESLGPVAKNIAEAQFAQEKEDRDIAQMQLDVAGRGLELQRQKSLQSLAARQMQQTGEPSGALPGGQRGFQIAPPDTNRMTGQQYYALAIARGVPPDEAMKGAAQIDRENIQVREGGVFNIREGRFYSTQYKEVPFQIGGKTYNLPEGVALELSHLARIGDVEGFNREARKAIRDFAQPAPAAPAQASPSQAAPAQAAPAQVAPAAQTDPAPAALVQTAPVPAAVPPAQAQPAAPVSPQAVAPSQVAPAPSGGDQRIDLVGGIFTPPTKNADDRSAIEQAVETYRWSSRLAAGLDKRPILNDPWPPEDREKARILAEKTKKRLEESFGMKVVTPVEQSPSRAAIILAETPPSAASPARPAQAAPQPAARPAEPAAPVVQQAAPSAVAQAAPVAPSGSRLLSQEEIAARKRESEIKEAADKKRAEELAKAAAAKEAAVEQTDITARRTYESANKVLDYLKSSPNYFGVFARPGVVSAIGGFIEQGLRTPQGTIDLPGFRESITKLMPNVRQQDLDNVVLAAAELAEIELNFSRMYFQGQGAVTENERKIVRAIPGSVSNSPRVLRARMELLRDRAQYDIDVADAFRNWQERNIGRSYLEFERESQLYKDIKKDFDQKAAKIFNGLPAMSTRERREAQQQSAASQQGAGSSASSVVQPSVGFIRDSQTGIIRRKRPGE